MEFQVCKVYAFQNVPQIEDIVQEKNSIFINIRNIVGSIISRKLKDDSKENSIEFKMSLELSPL